ncbi:MAG: PilT/PilU family type 4a pilus ATPase [Burkholderiales bacterium]|nr:PilT/PilU family type 4a pilus ATPase [Burkholderiales bacterium]
MQRLFQLMADKSASDIFLSIGAPINIKINGVAMPVNQQSLDGVTILTLLHEVISDKQKQTYEDTLELNTSYTMPGTGTFRISAFRQKGGPAVVVRYIPKLIPAFDTLGLPAVLKEVIMEKRGLVLMVGATGSGKSTTLAAMLDYRNEQKTGHILTIEDPVEYVFMNKKSIVNQREVGGDTLDFRIALKNALRQAPDCIMIGEVRDRDTMTAAIQYAQSGHLCLATLHANNSYHALNRIISFYPLENRPALLEDLSATLRCIISQRLVRNLRNTRAAAVEVLLSTRYISELIGKGEISEIKEAMEKSLSPGSQTFEQTLFKMLQEQLISQEEAMANSDSPTNLLWLINNTEAGGALRKIQPAIESAEPPPVPGGTGGTTSFSDIKLDLSEA